MTKRLFKTKGIVVVAAIGPLAGALTAMARPADRDEKTFIWKSEPTAEWPAEAKTMGITPPIFDKSGWAPGIIRWEPQAWYTVFMGELKTLFSRGLPGVRIIERIDTGPITDEQMRGQSGLTDGPSQPVKLRGVDLMLVPKFAYSYEDVTVKVERDAWKRHGEKGLQCIPYVGWMVEGERYIEIYHRHVTVTCDLKLLSITGDTFFTYSRSLAWSGMTRDGIILGIRKTDVRDLPDTHTIVKRLMREHAQEFCSEFMPVRKQITVNLRGMDDSLDAAVENFNAGRIREAGWIARARYARKDKDHHALFILGVCAESQRNWDAAAECYRRARDLQNLQLEYENALERVQNRDVVGQPVTPAQGGPAEGPIQQDNPDVSEVTINNTQK